jgi:hypothetical protein
MTFNGGIKSSHPYTSRDMMRKLLLLMSAGCFGCLSAFGATELKESKFTEVINDVQIISTTGSGNRAATVDSFFKRPEVLRTGPLSRAELVLEDRALARVGANTIFSFDTASHGVHLEQGSLLFDSPKGKGENSINTAAAKVTVRDATIIVATTLNGGSKILALEGAADVRLLKGRHQHLRAGEMMLVLPDGISGAVSTFQLDELVASSKLVSGFAQPLPSLSRINVQIAQQLHQIQIGEAQDITNTVPVINPIQEINGGHPLTPARPVAASSPPLPPPPIPIFASSLTFQNADLSNLAGQLSVNAHTIVLANVALPSSGNTVFYPGNGLLAPNPNTGQSVVPGDLNFIQNVTYQGKLASTPGIGFTVHH